MSTDTATATGREILARALGHEQMTGRDIYEIMSAIGATRGATVAALETAGVIAAWEGARADGSMTRRSGELIRWAQGRD
jgi:hypothetical protein